MSIIQNFIKTDIRCQLKFLINMGFKGMAGFKKYKKRKQNGELFPAFQFISVTSRCNLSCQGCWVTTTQKQPDIEISLVDKIINESKQQGSFFFGILGGEPLLYKPLLEIFKKHQDSYFQLFTNGTLLTYEIAKKLRKFANVTPLISFEGDENIADTRRGANNMYNRTLQAVEIATSNKLITGVAMSVCKSNIELALSDNFIQMLANKGVIYLWYYIYRPTGSNPCYELALSIDEINRLRRFMVEGRNRFPLVLIDSYWDADGNPFCPAAEGLSHHINPSGFIEPCPVIQFACQKIENETNNISELYQNSEFLKDFRKSIAHKTKGCILMEDPKWLVAFAEKHCALNTSGRNDMPKQLFCSPSVYSHGSCEIIPEKSWVYRFAKKQAFFGLGAYG